MNTKSKYSVPSDWYLDQNVEGVCNHSSRGTWTTTCYGIFCFLFCKVNKRSPKLEDFPASLLPAHKNVKAGIEDKFADRFRVQLWDNPVKQLPVIFPKTVITTFIDPTVQEFTVREAAAYRRSRITTTSVGRELSLSSWKCSASSLSESDR